MGRQIALKFSRKKEIEFSKYLEENGIKIIHPWTETKKIDFFKSIPPAGPNLYSLYLWNPKFKMNVEFGTIREEYIADKYRHSFRSSGKPIIDYSRGTISRIYWDKDSWILNKEYDREEFEKWYNEIVKWIKNNCKKKDGVYVG